LATTIAFVGVEAAHSQPPKTAGAPLVFTERSPVSHPNELIKRLGNTMWPKGKATEDYDLEKESFDAYVPPKYDGKKPFGLLVFISPGPKGGVAGFDRDGGWRKSLDEREIIWIGPNNAGNNRPPLMRLSLALDAAHNAAKKWKIDPERVYIGGVSGGGRCTSMLLMGFPDVFRGGYSIIGADFFRHLKSPEKGGLYQGVFKPPTGKNLALAKQRRFVLLTGDNDANREQMRIIHKTLAKEGWKNTFYFQVPEMGHVPPNGEWFAKGLNALDGEEK
jgi:hypothetical protein